MIAGLALRRGVEPAQAKLVADHEHVSGRRNLLFTNGFAFTSTVGISFETAAGHSVNIFSVDDAADGNAYGELRSNPGAFGVGHFTLTAVPETSARSLVGFAGLGIAVSGASQSAA